MRSVPRSPAPGALGPRTPLVANTLKAWRLSCPKRDTGKKDGQGKAIKDLHLVFPNGAGKVESLAASSTAA